MLFCLNPCRFFCKDTLLLDMLLSYSQKYNQKNDLLFLLNSVYHRTAMTTKGPEMIPDPYDYVAIRFS